MRVEIDAGVLDGRWDLELLGIFALALDGETLRHRIVTPDLDTWGPMRHPPIRDHVDLVREESTRLEVEGHPVDELRVADGPLSWGNPLCLPPGRAFRLLARPLRVVLENGWTDRSFLLAFAGADMRRTLEEAEREGWLHFESGGGVDGVRSRLEDVERLPDLAARIFAICDSDRREAGAMSPAAQEIQRSARRLAAQMGLPPREGSRFAHILERRAAESYVPPRRLLAYASDRYGVDAIDALRDFDARRATLVNTPGAMGTPRRHTLACCVLRELGGDVRAYLDMREGHGQNDEHPRTSRALWDQLDDVQKAVLRHGLGPTFIADFYAQAGALPDESGELTPLLETIRRRL